MRLSFNHHNLIQIIIFDFFFRKVLFTCVPGTNLKLLKPLVVSNWPTRRCSITEKSSLAVIIRLVPRFSSAASLYGSVLPAGVDM